MTQSVAPSLLLAAVDLGSNSFRLEVGRASNGVIVSEYDWKKTIRLAAGIDASGMLTEEAQTRALTALSEFRDKLDQLPIDRIRCVGTQALRIAKNANNFLEKAQAILGHPIEIIAGREEARLVYTGCAHSLPLSSEKRLVVDIGGGSTELIIGCGYIAKECESFHVGCVNTSVDFFANGKITPEAMLNAQLSAQAEFEEAHTAFSSRNWDKAYGSAGTIGAVATIGKTLGLTNGSVTPALLKHLQELLLSMGDIKNIELPGLQDDRREVIVGGLAVLSALFETFNIKEMFPAQGALRLGVLYDLLSRQEQRDTRDSTVASLIKRSNIDKQHAARVATLADKFFVLQTQSLPTANINDAFEARKLLQWSSMLHEAGRMISPSGYHHHSNYILQHSDLPGFSKDDQSCMAMLTLAQRGNLTKVQSALTSPLMAQLILALRLAVIFSHARRTIHLPDIKLTTKLGQDHLGWHLEVPESWLEHHLLTRYLLKQEEQIWARVGIRFALN